MSCDGFGSLLWFVFDGLVRAVVVATVVCAVIPMLADVHRVNLVVVADNCCSWHEIDSGMFDAAAGAAVGVGVVAVNRMAVNMGHFYNIDCVDLVRPHQQLDDLLDYTVNH